MKIEDARIDSMDMILRQNSVFLDLAYNEAWIDASNAHTSGA